MHPTQGGSFYIFLLKIFVSVRICVINEEVSDDQPLLSWETVEKTDARFYYFFPFQIMNTEILETLGEQNAKISPEFSVKISARIC